MSPQCHASILIALAFLVASSLSGCSLGRTTGKATFGSGSAGKAWSRSVNFSVDGVGSIRAKGNTATISFSEGTLEVEKDCVFLNEKELIKLPEDTKTVEVDYTRGLLTIMADGNKAHDSKLR